MANFANIIGENVLGGEKVELRMKDIYIYVLVMFCCLYLLAW